MGKSFVRFFRVAFLIVFVFSIVPFQSVSAAATLELTPITWNVVGLDSNNVNVGPNNFPVGVRVCNTGDAPAANVQADFVWDSANGLINLRPGSLDPITISSLANGDCYDFYFEVEIARNASAYDTTRRYHIVVTADGGISESTPTPREIYVEHLVSQNRNSALDVKLDGDSIAPGGTMAMVVGQTYTITLVAKTATQGYEQIESFINFPNTIFQVLDVSTTYSAPPGATSDMLYGDACTWENDPNSPNYRACLAVGKAGGDITVDYTVKIIGGAGTSNILNTLIYDFSGSSYHYNSDYSVGGRIAVIVDPTLVTISKNFNPDPTTEGGISKLTFTLTNPNGAAVSDVSFTDTFPTTPGAMVVANPPGTTTSGCGTPTFAPTTGAASISFSNGTIAANGTCSVSVNVMVPVDGVYSNTSNHLFVAGQDTGSFATDTLTVDNAPPAPACVSGLPMASWDFSNTTNAQNPPASSSSVTALADAGTGTSTTRFFINTSVANNQVGTIGSWEVDNVSTAVSLNTANNEYLEFEIDTTGFTSVTLAFWAQRTTQGAQNVQLYYGPTGATASSVYAVTTGWQQFTATLNSGLNTSGTTLFRLYMYSAGVTNNGHSIYVDGVTFTGCGVPQYPTLAKSFSPDPVAVGGTSTLTFTITNPNTTVALSGLAFSDSLPSGVTVATSGPTAFCGGSLETTAPSTITFTGGTLAANTSCNIPVTVTAATAGPHTNVSGFISATQTGTNATGTGSASDTLTAILPPTISKLFSPNPVLANDVSTLTFTVTNPNQDDALSGAAFSDTYPANLVNAAVPATSTSCGGTVTASAGGGSVSFSGGTIPAGGECTVTVNVTSSSANSYLNTSGNVSVNIVGNGNTASDTLDVEAPNPAIALLKQVSTSPTGPWSSFLSVASLPANVYYQLTVENTGDVPLSPVSLTDDTLNVSSCNTAWSSLTLQVADALDDDHIATCVVGPLTANAGLHTNTASATGIYSGTPYTSTSSAATYATPELSIQKSAAQSYFTVAGDVLNYDYLVENTGDVPLLGPVTVTDDKASVTCPAVSTVGDNDNYLDPGETITCTATYTVTASDVTAGSVTNAAHATVSGVDSTNDTVTVPRQLPDLTVTKTNNTGNSGIVGVPFTWTITVSNDGLLDATFADGQTLLSDPLPASAAYGSPTAGSFTGITNSASIICAIDGSDILTCTASGASVTLAASTSSFDVTFSVTPTSSGSLANTATVDPNNNIQEFNETNNTGSNTVTVEAASIFDPPSAIKTFSEAGLPELEFRMVWINSGNALAIDVQVTDNIPTGTTYVAGSITCEPRGSSSNAAAASSPLSAAAVPNSFCGFDAGNNRIQWQGNIGSDDGNLTEAAAANEVVITFRVTVNDGVNQVLNQGFSRTDVDDDGNFDEETVLGTSIVSSNQVIWNRSTSGGVEEIVELPDFLPKTGFAPGITTVLPEQPASKSYAATDVWMEIPSLGVSLPIVGVPMVDGDWNVSWLGNQAGWLEGTAFPSWEGNSALTGHVALADGKPGPFAKLGNLKWGDKVIVHAYGYVYVYQVRENKTIALNNTSVLKHEEDSWLTLMTCKNYNEAKDTYANRISIRAVLISVAKEQPKTSSGRER